MKSKLAKKGPSLPGFLPHRKSDASAFSIAASHPDRPPASLSLALSDAALGFVMRWTIAQPHLVAAALYAETALSNSPVSPIGDILSFWHMASGFWGLCPPLSSWLSDALFSSPLQRVGFPPLFPFFRAIADFEAMRTSLRE